VLLAALSTGNKIGLAVVGGTFILFALTSSFIAPRRRPDFPGKNGLSVFVLASFVLFAAMVTAVVVFGVEKSEAKGAQEPAGTPAAAAHTVAVSEAEFKITLPAQKLAPGKVTFEVQNAGKIQHDLVVSGPGVSGTAKTPLLKSGQTARLVVTLAAGTYTLYCNVPGHRAAGMSAKLTVG
jgi:uncharacterized cupredoxin-like copper-binding protein